MNRRARKLGAGKRPSPEYRLWLSYGGYLLSICGVVVFLVQINNAPPLHWNVSPIIGAGIAGAGNQIITTVLITYAVDCYGEDAASVGVFITFVRQVWGFIGPFWFPPMFTNVGLVGAQGLRSDSWWHAASFLQFFCSGKGDLCAENRDFAESGYDESGRI